MLCTWQTASPKHSGSSSTDVVTVYMISHPLSFLVCKFQCGSQSVCGRDVIYSHTTCIYYFESLKRQLWAQVQSWVRHRQWQLVKSMYMQFSSILCGSLCRPRNVDHHLRFQNGFMHTRGGRIQCSTVRDFLAQLEPSSGTCTCMCS